MSPSVPVFTSISVRSIRKRENLKSGETAGRKPALFSPFGPTKDVGRVYYQLAFLYYRMDEGDKTDQYIEKALSEFRLHGDRKNPYYAAALNGLGGILYQKRHTKRPPRSIMKQRPIC